MGERRVDGFFIGREDTREKSKRAEHKRERQTTLGGTEEEEIESEELRRGRGKEIEVRSKKKRMLPVLRNLLNKNSVGIRTGARREKNERLFLLS